MSKKFDSSNRQKMSSCSFQQVLRQNFDLVLVLTQENTFSLEVSFSRQQKDHRFFLKTVLGNFKIALRLRDRYIFMWQSLEIFNIFNTLTLKQIFRKMKTVFKKLDYSYLVESTNIETATFPYKTAPSEANVKTNRIVSTK